MWLLIIVGLGLLVIPLIIDVMAWLFLLAGIILIVSFFFHALLLS
ncbi:hypothetical protein [Liquorilactobacillus uvarum]|nr:hypothetical protein [Liquorilactobacillus uvarum]